MIRPLLYFALKLSLSLLIFAAALVPAELYLRRHPVHISYITSDRYQVSDDPRILYEPSASSGAVNEDGARGPRVSIRKSEGTIRIVVVGDSIAYGYGVAEEQTYSRRLESLLNAKADRGVHYEVINLGVEGYRATQVVARLEQRGMRYQPDIVIYGYWLDDVVNSLSSDQALFSFESKVKLDAALKRSFTRSAFEKRIRKALLELQIVRRLLVYFRDHAAKSARENRRAALEADTGNRQDPVLDPLFEEYRRHFLNKDYQDSQDKSIEPYYEYYSNRRNLTGLAEAMETLGRICREQGAVPILLLTPVLYDRGAEPYRWAGVHQLVRSVAERYGIETVDLEADFARYPYRMFTDRDHEHPNQAGHQLIAERLAKHLESRHFRLS